MTADTLVTDRSGIRKLAFVGFAGGLIGVGICRFAYTPLVPVMIGEGWITAVEAGYLGAVNFAGYMLGAAAAWFMARRWGAGPIVRLNLALCFLSLAAAALPWGYYWLALWRFAAGYGGAVLLVLVGPAVLSLIPAGQWGRVTGIFFTGVGGGAAATGAIVPLLAGLGATAAWLGLAIFVLILAVMAHLYWREPLAEGLKPPSGEASPPMGAAAILVTLAYGTYAIGIAPHSVFWVDYLARGLELGLAMGGLHWTVLGLFAVATPILAGRLADRHGFAAMLVVGMVLSAIAVGFPLVTDAPRLQFVSSILFGVTMPSTVVMFAGRAAEIGGRHGQRKLWWQMTLFFSLVQAVGLWGMTVLFKATGSYLPLFAVGGAVLALGAVLSLPVWGKRP